MNIVILAFDWNDDFSGSGCGGFAFHLIISLAKTNYARGSKL